MIDSHRIRLTLFGVLVLGLFAALLSRLWYLQVLTEEQFQVQASQNLFRTVSTPAARGRILDVNGNVLVGNRVTNIVEVDKSELWEQLPEPSGRRELAVELAREISRTGRLVKAKAIEDAFNDPKFGPFDSIPIASDVNEKFAILLGERIEDFPGVSVGTTLVREYPYAELAAHILGYVGAINEEEIATRRNHPKAYSRNDEIGKVGVESTFEDVLRGVPGEIVKEVDARNEVVNVEIISEPQPGQDIVLTIDINLQALVERELAVGIERARNLPVSSADKDFVQDESDTYLAPAGAMVLLDPDGAKVRAMASYPTFDPQVFVGGISSDKYDRLFGEASFAPLFNRAIQGEYSPGSTFKPITAYAAMDTGMLGPRGFLDVNEFTLDGGFFRIPGCETDDCVFQNAGREEFGDVDLRRSLAVSSDVFFYQLAYQFDARRGFSSTGIQEGARKFGLGSATGIALPLEASGRIPDPESRRLQHEEKPEAFPDPTWRAGDTLNSSIGQGDVAATPLQMANAYATLANGGTVYAPQIVAEILDPVTDQPVSSFSSRISKQLYMPDEIRNPLIDGLRAVLTDEKGTASAAFSDFPLDRWPLAAKTGTVETLGKQDSSAFAAFGPLPAPKFAAFTYVEQGGFGAATSGPIVREVFRAIANDDVAIVPTAQEIREYYQQFVASDEVDETSVPTGDIAEDIVRGLAAVNVDAEDETPLLVRSTPTTVPTVAAAAAETEPAPAEAPIAEPTSVIAVEPTATELVGERDTEERTTDPATATDGADN